MRGEPRVDAAHVEAMLAIRKKSDVFSVFQNAQAHGALNGVVLVFEGEGGESCDEGRVESGVWWLGLRVCHVEAELVQGAPAPSLTPEKKPCVDVKCKD